MPFYPNRLKYVEEVRGVDSNQMAALAGISSARYTKILDGSHIPSMNQITRLCDHLALPYFVFFSQTYQVIDFPITDFRSDIPQPLKYGANAKAIYRNIGIQKFLSELISRIGDAAPTELVSIDFDENPEQMATSIRYQLKLDEFQYTSETKRDFFNKLRKNVESTGVFVVQDHNISDEIDGFALFHEYFTSNLIFINSSKRNDGRKAFTLIHELAHILGKRSALSNDYERDNEVERYCNSFAASVLIPRNALIQFAEQDELDFASFETAIHSAVRISEIFKCSVSAALVRAHQVGLSEKNYYFDFAKSFGEPDHLDSQKPKQGGGPKEGPDQGKIVKAQLGERAIALLRTALDKNVTTPLEISESLGLSRKRIDSLYDLANREEYSL